MRAVAAAALACAACVPYPGVLPPEPPPSRLVSGVFAPLDPGASELSSLHFKVRAYGAQTAGRASEAAEAAYNRIMVDTNLFSFRPRGLYEIYVYGSPDEYHKKTGQPSWSGGVTVGNAIYAYQGERLAGTLAHEMTHLIFYEYMGRVETRQRWLNEGLAVYEEQAALSSRQAWPALAAGGRMEPLPMEQVLEFVPATERERSVSLWYAQAESLVRFLIEKGGRIGFSQFLAALRDGRSQDQALAAGFPAAWRSLADLEREWRKSLP